MNRRHFIVAAGCLALYPCRAVAQAADAEAFVRDTYTREVRNYLANTPAAKADYEALFTRETRALIRIRKVKLDSEAIGRILNTFFGWGVLPNLDVKLVAVGPAASGTGGAVVVPVDLTVRGEKRRVSVTVVREDATWRIADIAYDSGESFVAYFRRITGH